MITSVTFLTAAIIVGAPSGPSTAKQVEINVLFYRGDPKGSVEAGTMRITAMPTVTTIADRQAHVFAGREVPVVRDGEVEYIRNGRSVLVTPRSLDKRSVEVDVEFDDSSREDAPKLRAAMSGRVVLGSPVRLFLPTPPGEPQMWVEIRVNTVSR